VTATELITVCQSKGVRLFVRESGKLAYSGPAEAINDKLIAVLRQFKEPILAALRAEEAKQAKRNAEETAQLTLEVLPVEWSSVVKYGRYEWTARVRFPDQGSGVACGFGENQEEALCSLLEYGDDDPFLSNLERALLCASVGAERKRLEEQGEQSCGCPENCQHPQCGCPLSDSGVALTEEQLLAWRGTSADGTPPVATVPNAGLFYAEYQKRKEAEAVTPEEEEAARKLLEALAGMMIGTKRDCLHCGTAVEEMKKQGRCVYAYPCGCRQYQGDVPKWAKQKAGPKA
jgi:hypothetical protein